MTDTRRPTWTRGTARIEGEHIVLDGKDAHLYELFQAPDQHERLLVDLAELYKLGSIVNTRITQPHVKNPRLVRRFVERHGLLWHRPENDDSCRESWRAWLLEGHDLSLNIALYVRLREAIATKSTDGLRTFLRNYRDLGNAWGSIPEPDEELLEHVSILLGEQITKGLEGCSPALVAACSLVRSGGKKEGAAGDFRSSINPSNLVAVAYNELVTLIESRAWFKACAGCGKLFRLNPDIHHKDRTYCDDACYDRTRKRRQRAKKRLSL